jgi:murein DD-endopeptidase MepM/ murein hydrolase activator NlpD
MAGKRLVTLILLLLLATLLPADELVHLLQRGETLYTLARRYNVTVEELARHNSIQDPTRLAVGARIRVPGTYVVKQGDYVIAIARKLGVDWLDLLAENGLGRDDVVRPGEVLRVPGTRAAVPATAAAQPAVIPTSTPTNRQFERVLDWPHPGQRSTWEGKFPGVVMRGSVGDEFRSVTRGVVEYVGPFSSFGKLILVRGENGYLYGYAGAERVLVAAGDRVVGGTVLGTVGFSPAFESAMVLFTVWRNNRYVDPETAPRG